ncbi:hypothetical protein [Mesorhizobium cantuariense]|uniref:Uncharacterized protein n=1 Tax=Mesorhizobium cantuariense TaxID=1300275 RepID=A0ABV7MJM4_9HYPH
MNDQRQGDGRQQRSDRDVDLAGNEDDGAANAGGERERSLPEDVGHIAHGKEILDREGKERQHQDEAGEQRQFLAG